MRPMVSRELIAITPLSVIVHAPTKRLANQVRIQPLLSNPAAVEG